MLASELRIIKNILDSATIPVAQLGQLEQAKQLIKRELRLKEIEQDPMGKQENKSALDLLKDMQEDNG